MLKAEQGPGPLGQYLDRRIRFRGKTARAEHGDADAQYRLGSAYYYGKRVRQDYAEAARWYREPADQGAAKAQYTLGYCYSQGQGVPQDYAEAVRWYRRAADQGDATREYAVAYMYEQGAGVPCDYAEAVRWARKAAEQGNAKAQVALGYAYRWGQGVPQSYPEAARWYRKAAEQGDMAARLYLADAYRRGQGVPRNYVQAAGWFLKVIGPVTLHSERRQGWTYLVAVLLALAALVALFVPRSRWEHPKWLERALFSAACAVYALHLALGPRWCFSGRVLVAVVFATLSVSYAVGAVIEAVRARKRGSGPGQPPTAPTETTASLA